MWVKNIAMRSTRPPIAASEGYEQVKKKDYLALRVDPPDSQEQQQRKQNRDHSPATTGN